MKDNKKIEKEDGEMSRAEVIIYELRCGGFAMCELEEISDELNKAIEVKENED